MTNLCPNVSPVPCHVFRTSYLQTLDAHIYSLIITSLNTKIESLKQRQRQCQNERKKGFFWTAWKSVRKNWFCTSSSDTLSYIYIFFSLFSLWLNLRLPGDRFSKDPVTYWARTAILETEIRLPLKPALYICLRYKETAKFERLKRVFLGHTKRFMSAEKFRDVRETGPWMAWDLDIKFLLSLQSFTPFSANLIAENRADIFYAIQRGIITKF